MGYIEFYPIFYTDDKGHPAGQYIDLMKGLSKKAEYKIAFTSLPTKRMSKSIVEGEIDIWVGLKTLPEFQGTTYIGTIPISKIKLQAFWINPEKRIDSTKKEEILNRLKKQKIAIIAGYSYGGIKSFLSDYKNEIDLVEVSGHHSGLMMLKCGRIDYLLDYESPIQEINKKIKLEKLKTIDIESFYSYFIISKKKKNGEKILMDLEKALIAKRRMKGLD